MTADEATWPPLDCRLYLLHRKWRHAMVGRAIEDERSCEGAKFVRLFGIHHADENWDCWWMPWPEAP